MKLSTISNKVRLKLPKARLYRTNSIAKELRNEGVAFEWFNKNCIVVTLPTKDNSERQRTLTVSGCLTCYKVRVDVWSYMSGGSFTYYELILPTGRALLFRLVAMGLAPIDWLPSPVKEVYEAQDAQDLQPFGDYPETAHPPIQDFF